MASHYIFAPEMATVNIHPRFWGLHDLTNDAQIGLPDLEGKIVFPPLYNLSSEKLDRQGLYLLETGQEIFIWVGRNVSSETTALLIGVDSPSLIVSGKVNYILTPGYSSHITKRQQCSFTQSD